MTFKYPILEIESIQLRLYAEKKVHTQAVTTSVASVAVLAFLPLAVVEVSMTTAFRSLLLLGPILVFILDKDVCKEVNQITLCTQLLTAVIIF